MDTAKAIANALGISLGKLIAEAERMQNRQIIFNFVRVFRVVRGLNPIFCCAKNRFYLA